MSSAARPLVIATAFAASLVLGLLIMFWAMGGVSKVAQPAAIGGPFQLTDQNGKAVTDKSLKGKPTLIFFGYTHCPDVCPTSLFEISEVLRAMGKDADRVNAYFVSVDPERDTQTAMKDYLSSFDPHLKGLTGSPEEIEQFRQRQISRMVILGATAENKPLLEESYLRMLAAFEPHVGITSYLLGSRPSLADFAWFGQLSDCLLYTSPSPRD